jgi:uncharacterized protein
MGAAVVHWEINSRDAGRAQEFYSNLFGWNVNAENPMKYGMVDTNLKMGINGGIGQTQEGMSSYVTVYVQVENLQEHLDRAVQLGARVVMPVTEVMKDVTLAMFADPEGTVIGMIKGPQKAPRTTAAPKKKASKARAKGTKGKKPAKKGKKAKKARRR